MYQYFLKCKRSTILYAIIAPLNAIMNIGLAWAMAAAIDYALGGQLDHVSLYIIAFLAYILLDLFIYQSFKSVRYSLIGQLMSCLRADCYRHIMRVPWGQFQKESTANYISNLTTDMEILRESYFSMLLDMYVDGLQFVIACVVMFIISPLLGSFVLIMALAQMSIPAIFSRKLSNAGNELSTSQGRLMKTLKENLSSFFTIITYKIEKETEDNYVKETNNAENARRKFKVLNALTNTLAFSVGNIMFLGIFLVGAVLSIKGVISVGTIVAASQLMVYIASPLVNVSTNIAELRAASKVCDKILKRTQNTGVTQRLLKKERFEKQITITNLSFRYEEQQILSNYCCQFNKGQKYLITGKSGSGKSTLLDLIAGLYDNYTGSMQIDGCEIKCIDRNDLARLIVYNAQEPFLYDDTLYENVRLFAEVNRPQVENALGQVGLNEFLQKQPCGLDTRIGENGTTMSGGEKQRLAIARALIRNSSILLLDESTSHLDRETAAEIERLVMKLEGITVLLVSHNPTITAMNLADNVVAIP